MKDFTHKKNTRKLMHSVPVLVLLFVILCFFSVKTFSLYQKEASVREKAMEVIADENKLKIRQNELQQKVDFLQTERGKEEEMRGRFMIGEPGEGVIMVLDQKPTTTESVKVSKPSGWSGFLNFFR